MKTIESIRDVYTFFNSHFVDPKLNEVYDAAITARNDLRNAVMAFRADPTKAVGTVGVDMSCLKQGMPNLEYRYKEWGPSRSHGGGAFFFDDPAKTAVRKRVRISMIELRSGARIDRIETTYTQEDGTSSVFSHGRDDLGALHPPLMISVGNAIKMVRVYSGARVERMIITTYAGESLAYGGAEFSDPDNENNYEYMQDLPDANGQNDKNEFVVGFFGASGDGLDAIGVVTAKFYECTWSQK